MMNRRLFGKTLGFSAFGSLIPGSVIGANEKVNLAVIGCGGQGGQDMESFKKSPHLNVVALCDVQFGTKHTEKVEKAYSNAPKFTDFRKMFEKMAKEIDACLIATPDHSHFPIAMLAMSLGKHVYVEKPLAHTFEECELLMAAENKYKVVTQMGNQGHSGPNYFQFKAWMEAGIIKDVTKVTAYMNSPRRWHGWKVDGYEKGGQVPEGMDWEAWLATAPKNDFSDKLHPGDWRSWFDYGNGAFGDWGPHILDTIHEFLELGLPNKVTAVKRDGPSDWIFPQASTIRFDFPARGEKPAMDITWYDGVDNLPPTPPELEGRKLERNGKMIFSKEHIFKGGTHGSALRLLPESKNKDLAASLPAITGKNTDHYINFIEAVRGVEKTRSPFSVSGVLSQVFMLGVIAQRLGGEIEFDRATKMVKNNTKAQELLKGPAPRAGWEQYYKL
jgi:predicted dehydrogenase